MTTRGDIKAIIVEEKDMENVELHRAESMIEESKDILDQVNNEKIKEPKELKEPKVTHDVFIYVGTKARSIGSCILLATAEFLMFVYMFSYIMRAITSTNMIMDKVCRVHLKYSEDTCSNLTHNSEVKTEVERMANNYHLGHSLIQMMPSAILSMFIGSWSDKYGRKPPTIIALVGIILDGFGSTICAYYFNSRVEYYFIPAIFTGLSGGFIGVLMVLYSYASDVTSSGKRTMKYAFMELSFGLSMPLGALVGGWLFKFSGYVPVFLTSTCGHIVGLIWVIFVLEESRGLDNTDSWKTKFINFWTLDSVVSSFKATVKKRPNQGSKQIWLLIMAMSIGIFSFASLAGIMFFYVHHQFDWENTTYSTISAIYSIIGLSMMLIIVPWSKKKNIGDPILGIVGSISLALKNIGIGLAFKTWIYHLANLLGLLSSLGSLACRSRISKLVPKDDLGKVFSFMTTAECFLPLAATAIVSQGFNATIEFFPGLMFVVMGVLIFIPLGVFIWIARLPVANYEEMQDEKSHNIEMKQESVKD